MNRTASKDSVAALEARQPKRDENTSATPGVGLRRVAVLGTADQALAQRLSRDLCTSIPKQAVSVVASLTLLRELLKTCAPGVIFLDTDLLGELSLSDAMRLLASTAPVLVLASLNAEADVARLVQDDRVDFIARVGDFLPLASAMIVRRLNQENARTWDSDAANVRISPAMSEIFRHEINNPLTGILGNAELVLAHREHFSGVEVQRLQTVVDLAVRLRENIRRISNSWEELRASKTS
jgi:signal transduction histidine kinase